MDPTMVPMPPQDPMQPPMGDPMMGDPSMMQPPMDPAMMQGPMGPPPDPTAEIVALLEAMTPEQMAEAVTAMSSDQLETLLASLADKPELVARLLNSLPLPADYEPERPKWFKKPPQLSIPDALEIAQTDWDWYAPLRDRYAEDYKLFFNKLSGSYEDDKDRTDVQRFKSTALAAEVNLCASIIGSMPPRYQIPALSPDLTDETQKAEDWLYDLDDKWSRRHARRGNGPLWRDVAMYNLMYGRIIARRVLDLNDPDDPWDEVLLDPAKCCPIEGGKHGLIRMTVWYSDTVANVCRDYDITDMKSILKPKGKNLAGKTWEELKVTSRVTVVEWWDEYWRAVFTHDGRIIKPMTAHKYGEVPFVYQLSGLGWPNGATDPSMITGNKGTTLQLQQQDDAAKYKGVSHIHWLKIVNAQREAYLSKVSDAILKTDNPPIWMGMDTFAKNRAPSKMGMRKGKVYTFETPHETPQVPQFAPLPPTVSELGDALGQEMATIALPMSAYGQAPSNTSGAALDGIAEMGRDKLTPHLQAVESFYARRAEQSLRWWRDWGKLIQDSKGQYGVSRVPSRRSAPNKPVCHEITPDLIQRTGCNVQCKVTSTRLQNLGALGAAVAQWTGINAMSLREAMELRDVRDPDAVFGEIDYEKALLDPRVADIRRLVQLLRRSGEEVSDDELNQLTAQLWAQQLASSMQGGGGGDPAQGGNPAQPQMGGPQPPGVSAGVDMGNYGAPPGAQGGPVGRPPMGGPPPGAPVTDFNPA